MAIPLYPNGAVFPGHQPEPAEATTVGQLVETATAEQLAPVQMAPVNTVLVEPAKAVQQQAEYMRTLEEIGNFFFTVCESLALMGLAS